MEYTPDMVGLLSDGGSALAQCTIHFLWKKKWLYALLQDLRKDRIMYKKLCSKLKKVTSKKVYYRDQILFNNYFLACTCSSTNINIFTLSMWSIIHHILWFSKCDINSRSEDIFLSQLVFFILFWQIFCKGKCSIHLIILYYV